MQTIQNGVKPVCGTLLWMGERRKIAVYLRNSVPWVADFTDGRGELYAPGAVHFLLAGVCLPVWSGVGNPHRDLLAYMRQSRQWWWRGASRAPVQCLATL